MIVVSSGREYVKEQRKLDSEVDTWVHDDTLERLSTWTKRNKTEIDSLLSP